MCSGKSESATITNSTEVNPDSSFENVGYTRHILKWHQSLKVDILQYNDIQGMLHIIHLPYYKNFIHLVYKNF